MCIQVCLSACLSMCPPCVSVCLQLSCPDCGVLNSVDAKALSEDPLVPHSRARPASQRSTGHETALLRLYLDLSIAQSLYMGR